jgi:hypothetical protein
MDFCFTFIVLSERLVDGHSTDLPYLVNVDALPFK